MTRLIPVLAILAGLIATTVAFAQQPTPSPLMMKAKVEIPSGGTKKKPKPVSVDSLVTTSTADGSRPESFSQLLTKWGGVRSNGEHFPKCTKDKIDLNQSDASCPKGSLVAKGTLNAKVGAESDFSNPGADCEKDVRIYNAGKNKMTSFLTGPVAKCAGVTYLSPWTLKWSDDGGIQGGQRLIDNIPENISHPFPGILGSTVRLEVHYKKLTTKVKGKTVGFLESIGCDGKRKAEEVATGDPSKDKIVAKTKTGSC